MCKSHIEPSTFRIGIMYVWYMMAKHFMHLFHDRKSVGPCSLINLGFPYWIVGSLVCAGFR